MKSVPGSLKGTWKIIWMEMWDQEFVDLEVPGHMTLEMVDGGISNSVASTEFLAGPPKTPM
jgi:hypothetical protein